MIGSPDYLKKAKEIFENIEAKSELKKTNELLLSQNKNTSHKETDILKEKRKLSSVFHVSQMICNIVDPKELLNKIMDSIIEIMGAERGFLMLYPEEKSVEKVLEIKVARDINKENISEEDYELSEGVIKRVEEGKKAVVLTNAQDDPNFKENQSIVKYNLRSILSAPLTLKGEMIGLVYLDNKLVTNLFTEEDLDVLLSLATQASISIVNAMAHEKLARTERLATIGEAAGAISHDLRNPLTVIKEASSMLEEYYNKNQKTKELLDMIIRAINESNQIITNTLNFARMKKAEKQETDINSIIISSTESLNIPENVKLTLNPSNKLPFVMADPIQLGEVFKNLILDGIQAMPRGGELKITSSLLNKNIKIDITDTGIGIPKENLNKIFEPLFTTKSKGTGFGLAVCKRNIEALGGKISVDSAVDQGTTFTILLPIASQ